MDNVPPSSERVKTPEIPAAEPVANAPEPITPPPIVVPPPVTPPPSTPPPPTSGHSTVPPLIVPPTRAARKPEGSGWRTVAICLICILGLVMLYQVFSFFIHNFKGQVSKREDAGNLVESVIEDNDASEKIAVLHVNGVIASDNEDGRGRDLAKLLAEELKKAGEDKDVHAVILKVDSPGGEVLASDNIARAIEKFQKEHQKPVIASMGSLAASGGYYVCAPCRWIVANELTITGSIGVIMHGYNYRGLMNKVGVAPEVFKSGRFKDMLSGEKDVTTMSAEEKETYKLERKMVQDLIDETYAKFKDVVQKGRGNPARGSTGKRLAPNWADYADGRILSGKQALDLGFVDELGTFEDAVARAKKLAGIENATLIEYQIPFDLSNLFRLLGKSEAPALKVDLGLNPTKLPTGRLYFLSPVLPF